MGGAADDAAGFADPVSAVNNGTGSSPFDDFLPWAGMGKEPWIPDRAALLVTLVFCSTWVADL